MSKPPPESPRPRDLSAGSPAGSESSPSQTSLPFQTTGSSITRLLDAHRGGDASALDQAVALLYQDLRRLAHFELRRLKPWETLNTTGLVHEAFVKLAHQQKGWKDRAHFLAASAKAMRHILVDAARRRLSLKKGAGQRPEPLEEARIAEDQLTRSLVAHEEHAANVLAVDQALEQLRALDERMCQVVECQFFAGYSKEETAEALQVSVRTVHRDWLRAKGWLRQKLGPPAQKAPAAES